MKTLIDTLASTDMSEPSLWTIVIALAGVVAWMGRSAWKRLNDCESDREVLHKRVGKLEVGYAIIAGRPLDDDNHTQGTR